MIAETGRRASVLNSRRLNPGVVPRPGGGLALQAISDSP